MEVPERRPCCGYLGGGEAAGTGQGSVPINMALGLLSGTDEQGCEQLGRGCKVWKDSGFNSERVLNREQRPLFLRYGGWATSGGG